MIRQAVLLLLAACVAPHLAWANEDDAGLLDTPLFATSEDTMQPQRSLLGYPYPSASGYYGGSYGGYYGGYYGGTPAPKPCKPGRDYEVYFLATNGVIKSKATGKFRVGLFRDKLLIPELKKIAAQYALVWKFPVTNYSRCVVKKTRPFQDPKTGKKIKRNFFYRVVCNLTDVPCTKRNQVRNKLRNAAKLRYRPSFPRDSVILISASNV